MSHSLTVVQWLLLAVAVQQSIFAVAWLAISKFAGLARLSARYWAVFCGVGSVSILLLALRGNSPDLLSYQVADVLLVVSATAARHASALFFDRPTPRLEHGLIIGLAILGAGLTGTSVRLEEWRIAVVCLLIAWIAVRAVWGVHANMAREFGPTISLALHIPTLIVAAALLWRGAAVFLGNADALNYRSAHLVNELLTLLLLLVASFLSLVYGGMLMARLVRRLRDLALKDTLTGLLNRRAAQELLEREWAAYRQKDLPFCVLMIDIDHFKHINDAYGHAVGDKVLTGLAARLREGTRPSDHAARMGGEEFLVFLPQTELPSARAAAERLRQHIATWTLEPEHLTVTVSIGVAQATAADQAFDDLLIRADSALYAAKAAGRNQVHLAQTTEAEGASLAMA
ncbi:MAG: GGDEF domain-containing protein [Burkholderiaceae bacterium]|nr:GGDEF domain-containing protein [Burkholderiaceae bacterium]